MCTYFIIYLSTCVLTLLFTAVHVYLLYYIPQYMCTYFIITTVHVYLLYNLPQYMFTYFIIYLSTCLLTL